MFTLWGAVPTFDCWLQRFLLQAFCPFDGSWRFKVCFNVAFIGPFSVGKTEIDGDPLYGYFDDGALGDEIQVGNNSQLLERQVMSEHVSGGQVYWSKIRGKGGYASLAPQTYDAKVRVDLNSVVQSTSSITIQESQGWLYGYLKGGAKDFNKSFRLHCQGLHTVWVGNKYYHGDIYSGNKMFINFVWETGRKGIM